MDPVTHPPPAGGYGSAPPSARFGPAPEAESGGARRSLRPFITVGLILVSISTMVLLAVVLVRQYIGAAKTAEVRGNLATIAQDAAAAHEAERRVCPSASLAVPASDSNIRLRQKYQSMPQEWRVDQEKNAGFSCLHFEMSTIQHYQYRYEATASSFTAGGRGMNGRDVYSDFTWSGHVEGGRLVIAPEITEKKIEE